MKLADIGNALATVTPNCFRYYAHKQTNKYIVWAEDGPGAVGIVTRALSGTIDYYTKQENDPNVQNIETVLKNLDIAWRINSIQYEEDTKYIHYEWVWEGVFEDG